MKRTRFKRKTSWKRLRPRRKGKPLATPGERKYLAWVKTRPCRACMAAGYGSFIAPSEAHHIRAEMGMGQKAPHANTLPICSKHHRQISPWISIHGQRTAFEKFYGSELEMLAEFKAERETQAMLKECGLC